MGNSGPVVPDPGQPERDVAAMAHHLGADLDQLLPQAGQRPRLRRLRHNLKPSQRLKVDPLAVEALHYRHENDRARFALGTMPIVIRSP